MNKIQITFPDQSVKQYEKNITLKDIASSISMSLKKDAIIGIVNNKIYDLITPITTNSVIEIITDPNRPEVFQALNHTAAHLTAHAIENLYSDVKIEYGPATEEGYFHNFEFKKTILSTNDFPKIEKEMTNLINKNDLVLRKELTIEEALKLDKDNKFKVYQINKLKNEKEKTVSYYFIGNHHELCKGPHIDNFSLLKAFKLLSLSSAYHLGDEKNESLTRVYGTAQLSKQNLDTYLNLLQERKERDHRKIGKDLKLFFFDNNIGKGLPIWLPNGTKLKNAIRKLVFELEEKYGFIHVETPVLGSAELYYKSGHLPHYKDTMFPIIKFDDEEYVLRPMSCPHHLHIYRYEPRSYRDLPLRYAEEVILHRYEKSGALLGLERVRSMSLTDSHIFARLDQIEEEVVNSWNLIEETLNAFNLKIDYVELALHDPKDKDNFFPNPKMWEEAETKLEAILKKNNIKYKVMIGEAAFYGPKIDLQFKTILNHIITVSTIQLDFLQPERFNLEYIDKDGTKKQPVMIHRGLIGTYERFISVLLEQTKGVLPFRFNPIQIRIIPVSTNEKHLKFAKELINQLKALDYRIELDDSLETLNKKIRNSQISKIPYSIIIGDQEIKNNTLSFRQYGNLDIKQINNEKNIIKRTFI